MASQNKRPPPNNDNESTQFNFNFSKFLVIKSEETKPITSLSPFIIKDRTLKGETEENIVEYLAWQGVIACKRFRIKKDAHRCSNL